MSALNPKLLISIFLIASLLSISVQFTPSDKYLINCGSSKNTTIGGRVFSSDTSSSHLSTPTQITLNTTISSSSSNNISSSTTYYASDLYSSARLFTAASQYNFPITTPGRHWVRLYFYPFTTSDYDLGTAKFSVTCQNFTLLTSSHLDDTSNYPILKEYSINVTSSTLILTFTPSTNSFAYLNALEIISVPDELIPTTIPTVGTTSSKKLSSDALETVIRLNMGNKTVYPQNDTLSRLWAQDGPYLKHNSLVKFVTDISAVNYTSTNGDVTDAIAPPLVYGTASRLNSELDPNTRINMTWSFKVDPGFHYMVRFHFCDIVKANGTSQAQMMFAIYINSWVVDKHYDLSNHTSDVFASPRYLDVVVKTSSVDTQLNVSIGPAELDNAYPNGLLNGLEVMKLNNSDDSLVLSDDTESGDSTKWKIILIASLTAGGLILAVVISVIVILMCRRRRKLDGVDGQNYLGNAAIMPKAGYRFPLSHIREATGNFGESLVIGVGGFGKVYKGVLKDGTVVAVKRGSPDSQQGLAEFRTELEMLSQFRHRHLVSLIGYCDEQSELIIVYEYMENGTLKSLLYGSDVPKLSWKQRLEICIGSARGLHYLHTGSTKAIIHRDVKSANILLDENLMAKVADFGLSKTGPEIDQTHVSTAVKGSFGYLDPEYLLRQQLTEKSDVYSFGVVLFEVLCGRPVIDPSRAREEVNLVELAMKWQKRGELQKIIDPAIADQIHPDCLKKVSDTAEKCLAQCGLDRPSMGEVLWNLECALQVQLVEDEEEEEALKQQSSGDDVVIQIDESRPLRPTASTARLSSLGSMADMPDISMAAVFSEMTKRERS